MGRRWGALVAALAMVGMLIWLPASRSHAQGGASPVASPSAGLSFPGASLQTLASGTADQLPGSAPLILERITLAPSSTTGMRQIPAPELLVVESGSLTVADSLGLSSTMISGQQQLVPANASYEARNDSTSAVTFLRLRLGEAKSVAAEATAVPGTLVSGTPAAQPAVSVLFSGKDDNLPSGSATLFIAQATFDANADSGNQTSTGPIGIAVTQGTLTIGTATGIQGQLPTGKGIVLPSGTVYHVRNQGTGTVGALIAGVVAANGPAAQSVIPTPTPTVIPTATSIPTSTPAATSTPAPTATSVPTATPAPPTPTPTPVENVLYQADWSQGLNGWTGGPNWKAIDGMAVSDGTVNRDAGFNLTAPFFPGDVANYAEEADIQYVRFPQNPNDCPSFGVDARVTKTSWYYLKITADSDQCYQSSTNPGRNTISLASISCDQNGNNCNTNILVSTAYTVDTNWHMYRFELNGNNLKVLVDGHLTLVTQDNLILGPGKVRLFADYTEVNVRNFRVVAVGGSSSGPAPVGTTSAATGKSVAQSVGGITAAGSAHHNPAHIADMLPNQGDVPSGMAQTANETRTLDEVAQNYTNPSDTIAKFTSWGWKGNVVRDFGVPAGASAPPGGINMIHVSIHRFGSAAGAAAALDYSVTDQAASTGVPEVAAPSLGDKTRALTGQTDQGHEITLYIQRADVLIRLTVDSPDADPTNAAVQIADTILSK